MRKILITTVAGSLLTAGAWLAPSHADTSSSCRLVMVANGTLAPRVCTFIGDAAATNGWVGTLAGGTSDPAATYAIYSATTTSKPVNNITTYTTTYDCVPQNLTKTATTTTPSDAGSVSQGLATCGLSVSPQGAVYSDSAASPAPAPSAGYFASGTTYTVALAVRNGYMDAGDLSDQSILSAPTS